MEINKDGQKLPHLQRPHLYRLHCTSRIHFSIGAELSKILVRAGGTD